MQQGHIGLRVKKSSVYLRVVSWAPNMAPDLLSGVLMHGHGPLICIGYIRGHIRVYRGYIIRGIHGVYEGY